MYLRAKKLRLNADRKKGVGEGQEEKREPPILKYSLIL